MYWGVQEKKNKAHLVKRGLKNIKKSPKGNGTKYNVLKLPKFLYRDYKDRGGENALERCSKMFSRMRGDDQGKSNKACWGKDQ